MTVGFLSFTKPLQENMFINNSGMTIPERSLIFCFQIICVPKKVDISVNIDNQHKYSCLWYNKLLNLTPWISWSFWFCKTSEMKEHKCYPY